jgi:hypothetical protein
VAQIASDPGTLQDFASIQVPLLLGLASVLAGDALQDRFAVFCRDLVNRGRRVLGGDGTSAAAVSAGANTT